MNTKGLIILLGIPVLTIVSLLFINNIALMGDHPYQTQEETLQRESSYSQGISPNQKENLKIPTDTEFIELFFNTIQSGNINVALSMMDKSTIQTQDQIDTWVQHFNAFKTAKVLNMEESEKDTWTDTMHKFKVNIGVEIKDIAKGATIPNFGWDEGDNIRWITVIKGEDELWRIKEIATGM